jgi:hypothetical protein
MDSGLHFTVASSAGRDNPGVLDLSEDLALVKASLLYADKVRLCSLGSSVLSSLAQYAEDSPEERAKLVVRLLPELQPSMGWDKLRFFRAAVGLGPRRERRAVSKSARREIMSMVRQQDDKLRRDVVENHRATGIEGFREAVHEGILEVHTFRQTSFEAIMRAHIKGKGNLVSGVDIADVIVEFLEVASDAVASGTTYPLLDAPTAEFVAAAEGTSFADISPTAAAMGRHSGLAGDLLRRLPLFERANISDVLDIRRDLHVPLLGFRTAVRDFSREVRSAAWQEGFAEEAKVLFHEKVEPEVDKIEYAVKENSSYAELGRRALDHGGAGIAGAFMGGFLANASSLVDISAAALLGGVGSPLVKALLEKHRRLRELEENQLYFYFAAGEILGGRRSTS